MGKKHGPVALGVLHPAFTLLELFCLLSFEPGNNTSLHAFVGSADVLMAAPTAEKFREDR